MLLKRKRENEDDDANLPFLISDMKTPDTPYGAFLKADPSPKTRKLWKRQCEDWSRYQMTDGEKAKLKADREKIEANEEERRERRKAETERLFTDSGHKGVIFLFYSLKGVHYGAAVHG